MTVLITLTIAGSETGPFDLYSNLDFYASPFEVNISKATLQAGYLSVLVPNYTNIIRAKSKGMCIDYTDIVLMSTTTTTLAPTTTTTTTLPEVPCNSTTTSGGVGVTEDFINLSPEGGLITIAMNAQGVPDKLEIIHNGVKKATTSMSGPNEGPFDNLYGDPTVPTEPETVATVQFIGSSKGSIPTRQTEFTTETSSPLTLPGGFQQLIWWQYTALDYADSPTVMIRVTGPTGTAWSYQRLCDEPSTTTTTTEAPITTTTTTTAAPTTESVLLGYSTISGPDACADEPISPVTRYLPIGQAFLVTSVLYQNAAGTIPAQAGYYSDGAKWRQWDEVSFIAEDFC